MPKTGDIIAAIPENWKTFILPKIRAKPVRTASGVRISWFLLALLTLFEYIWLSFGVYMMLEVLDDGRTQLLVRL